MEKRCENCLYWDACLSIPTLPDKPHLCKRFPPVGCKYAWTEKNYWCGEFKEKEDEGN